MHIQRQRLDRIEQVQEKIAKSKPNDWFTRGEIYVSAANAAIHPMLAHDRRDYVFALDMFTRAVVEFSAAHRYHFERAVKMAQRLWVLGARLDDPVDTRPKDYSRSREKWMTKAERDARRVRQCYAEIGYLRQEIELKPQLRD